MSDLAMNPCAFCGGECVLTDVNHGFCVRCRNSWCQYSSARSAFGPDAIRLHNSVAPPAWIPVGEGLPELDVLGVPVDVAFDGGTLSNMTMGAEDGAAFICVTVPQVAINNITHYRPHTPPRGPGGTG